MWGPDRYAISTTPENVRRGFLEFAPSNPVDGGLTSLSLEDQTSERSIVIWGRGHKQRGAGGRTSNPPRRRGRIRKVHGKLEPARGTSVSRLACATPGLAMDRYRLRQSCLHGAARPAMRASRSSGN